MGASASCVATPRRTRLSRHRVSVKTSCIILYVPRLWTRTIEAHRLGVRDAILRAAAGLVAEHGLRSVTMSEIAEEAGIGRATLYRYFRDVDAILLAWHQRHVTDHLQHLAAIRDNALHPIDRLEGVLKAYALIRFHREQHDLELASLVHRHEYLGAAQRQLRDFLRDLLIDGAGSGDVRADVPPEELAIYCLSALDGAGSLPDEDAVSRLVGVIASGLRPSP